jgi:hypothetical protein
MLRLLQSWLGRRSLRFGLERDSRGRLRNSSFVSFLASNNRKTLNTDFQDTVLRGRRLARSVLLLALVAGGAWVALESAHAFSIFK